MREIARDHCGEDLIDEQTLTSLPASISNATSVTLYSAVKVVRERFFHKIRESVSSPFQVDFFCQTDILVLNAPQATSIRIFLRLPLRTGLLPDRLLPDR